MYDRLSEAHPLVGGTLRKRARLSFHHLWYRCNLPFEDPNREGLGDRCTVDWYAETFCNGVKIPEEVNRDPTDLLDELKEKGRFIWEFVRKFQLYDPLNLYASIPEIQEEFFDPILFGVGNKIHKIIGLDKNDNGILNDKSGELFNFMLDIELEGLKSHT